MRCRTQILTRAAGALLYLTVASTTAVADPIGSYNLTNLDARTPVGINNQGQVGLGSVYQYPFLIQDTESVPQTLNVYNSFGSSAGVLVPSSSLYPLPSGGNGSTVPTINDSGAYVSYDSQGNADLNQGGTVTQIGPDHSVGYTEPLAVNNAGQVAGVGWVPGCASQAQAFLFSNGVMKYLGALGDSPWGSTAEAINSSGVVVGYSTTPGAAANQVGQTHAFVYQNSTMTDLNPILGSTSSHAYGINSSGAIVGDMSTGASTDAFLLMNGKVTDLNSLLPAGSPWVLLTATGINDLGQIIGFGTDNGKSATFLLTPSALGDPPNPPALVPEPSSILCFTTIAAAALARSAAMRSRL